MVKRPLVIPTVRVVHVCPPIVVRTNLSDFAAVVQELTGLVKNTVSINSMRSSRSNEHFDQFMVSDSRLSSPLMHKSDEEDGSRTLIANDSMSACTCDHQNNHTKRAPSYDAWMKAACSDKNGALLHTINGCTNECENGMLMVDELPVWPSEDCLDDLKKIDEELVCINEVGLLGSCNYDFSSFNWTTASGYGMSNKQEGDNMECIANAWTSGGGGAQLTDLVYPQAI